MKKIIIFLTLVVLLVFAGSLLAMSSDNFRLDWFTPLTTSSGSTTESANYVTQITVGQSVIGGAASTNYHAGLGYWGSMTLSSVPHMAYLPIIIK